MDFQYGKVVLSSFVDVIPEGERRRGIARSFRQSLFYGLMVCIKSTAHGAALPCAAMTESPASRQSLFYGLMDWSQVNRTRGCATVRCYGMITWSETVGRFIVGGRIR